MNLVAIPASLLFLTDTLQEESIYCNLNFSTMANLQNLNLICDYIFKISP